MVELDVGCGKNKRSGSIGLDMNPGLEGYVDIFHEIKSLNPLPFGDDSFEKVHMNDIVEHIHDIPWLLSEVHRVAKARAIVCIQYPHYSGKYAYGDVTHCHYLGLRAFDHFIPGTELGDKYQYYTLFGRNFPFELEKIEPKFLLGISDIVYKIVGIDMYESLFCRVLPISNVNLELRVLKT